MSENVEFSSDPVRLQQLYNGSMLVYKRLAPRTWPTIKRLCLGQKMERKQIKQVAVIALSEYKTFLKNKKQPAIFLSIVDFTSKEILANLEQAIEACVQ